MLLRFVFILTLWFSGANFLLINAQQADVEESTLVTASREIIRGCSYCAFITVDESGQPQARMMETLPFENIRVAWFGTNKNSRKVREIENNPRVTLFYAAPSGNGYVVLNGTAVIVDDENEKQKHWQEGWDQYYPDREKIFVLIKVNTTSLEVVSYEHGLEGDSVTWRAPNIELK
jgi:general stress protein 26